MNKDNKSTEVDSTDKKLRISDVSNSYNLDDLKRAYVAGFSKHCEMINEGMYDIHWKIANDGFEKWVENGYKSWRDK